MKNLKQKEKIKIFNITPINTDITDLESFEKKVKICADLGATHVFVTEVVKDTFFWDMDRSDPYPNWGMLNSSLFKIILPEPLKKYYPKDYTTINLELVKRRTEILRKYNLRGAANFCEPFYMPESVYKDHPDWRGPRTDHPRRAKNAYYSPCLDNEEVLELYQNAMEKLCEIADIEYVYLHANDCGSGICWSDGLYVGKNGPEQCKHKSMTDRILGYLRAFKEGASKANRNIYIEINGAVGIKDTQLSLTSVWPFLDDNMCVQGKNNKGGPLSFNVDINHEFTFAPVRCFPMAVKYLELLEEGYNSNSNILKMTLLDDDFDLIEKITRKFFEKPTNGVKDRFLILYEVAEELVTKKYASNLVDAWYAIHNGYIHYTDTLNEGMTWTSINQRLINRPFVLFPKNLLEEEKQYYRSFQFQAQSETHAEDLMDQQGSTFVKDYYSTFLVNKAYEKSIKYFKKAQELIKGIETLNINTLIFDRIELLICFFQNNINAMWFQQIIDKTNFNDFPNTSTKWPQEADPIGLEYERLTRAEIENTYKIIKLIQGREREMLVLAPSVEQEDIFWCSPELVNQLYKKIEIMFKYQLDGKKVFTSNNK